MDSIFAIGFGLGLRFVVDTVSHHDFKLTGTLVGLWEGVILLHFLKKMPKSSDPFIAYGVRLFIDFLFTESVARMVLVLIWTALGMVLADITPAIWDDVGLKRIWKHFRRDIYTMTQMIPIVAFFPPARTVRFSPSRAPSVISEAPTGFTPSAAPTGQTPTTTEREPVQRRHVVVRRRLPGYFSMDNTDTETDAGSVISVGTFGGITGRTARRLSVYPGRMDLDSQSERSTPSQNDLDEGNISDTSSNVTERGPYSAIPDPESIPDMEVEEPLLIDVTAAPVKLEDGEVTPTNKQPYYMPPTPSDSAIRWPRESDEPLPVLPTSASVPEIPNFLEESNTEDWEKIQRADYTDEHEKPPTPPAKDDLPAAYREQAQPQTETSPDDIQNWETLASQTISPTNNDGSNDNNNDTNEAKEKFDENPQASTSAAANRQSQPPPYDYPDDFDDMYVSDPQTRMQEKGGDDVDLLGGDSGVPPETIQPQNFDDVFNESNRPLSDLNFGQANPWSKGFATQAFEIEATRQKELEAEAERARQQDEEVERLRQEEEIREKERQADEEKAKKLQEKEEKKRLRLEKKRLEQEQAQRQKEEEERLAQEERAEKERIEEEKKKRAEEKAERSKKEADDAAARQKKREEEAEAARLQEETQKKREEEEKKRIEEEAEAKKQKEAAEALAKEEAEKQRLEEERLVAERKAEEERQERERAEHEEAEKRKQQLADEEAQKAEEAKARREEDLRKLREEFAQEQADADAADAGRRTPTPENPQVELTTDAQDELPTQEQDPFPDSETVVTEASEMPSFVRERLQRTILTRAQISELESQIEDLNTRLEGTEGDDRAKTEEEIRAMQKIIRKLRRKEERRATEGA